MATCTRLGCGKKFDPDHNLKSECVFHPGQPVFHEGLKSWSCCKEMNKPVMEFDQFMKIEGCATGVHSLEKPVVQTTPAAQVELKESSVDANGTMTFTTVDQTMPALMPTHQTTQDVFQPIKPEQAIESQPVIPKPELQDDPESIVTEGSKCKRLACGITWHGLGNCKRGELDKEECTYHPGTPVFHEGSKGYSCCKRRVLDFDDFLRLRGCKKSSHLFTEVSGSTMNDQEESVESRFDFYQTPTSVIVSIFAKKVDQEKSLIKFNTSTVDVDLKLPSNKRFRRTFNLFGLIDPDQSTYKILSTKCEMVLIKSDGRSWSNLEKGDAFVGTVTFGVGGRTGTVGAKQIVT
ncbi:hypothetical protein PGT21_032913 [Puccinia graminis f. sp. tritici]|uniref:Integrin beta-1-binding protein 2 n=3 Tax=Puccinia graminis f. sp. tritici TaxID=56615 RepID=E3L0S6_PUCGT|nr:uncharacterized protein PGTG_15978 [Puccinia graminis f. sp. tritici CRL 75-36-700-3]EFP90130.1 hypothetical protein PGTG_15978 [Puccinia graminis f. sp. tritici CRL 75-36-700-3]KAA1072275.1 hypothetical protein PGT21_031621 [Puccinia graminis f. sp. tritici]KAA1078295.1 hypothetical protein PGT21_032913 [Puccinia graminis f. sp. tritici]KAA1086312.1 hypothetical protein PGTUg99_009705 [Puccinia graminis f. sp. tritici]